MLRPLFTLAAFVLAASPAAAATYSARTATPPPAERIAARDILWTCTSGTCTGSTLNSRPVVLCEALAKQAGRIDSFLVDGREISAPELQRCNAAARETASALANAR
jgi:hypothetical protein